MGSFWENPTGRETRGASLSGRGIGEIVAAAALEHSADRMKLCASRATAGAEEPHPFAPEVTCGSTDSDRRRNIPRLLTRSMHAVVKRDALRGVTGIRNPDLAPLLTQGGPRDGASDHVTVVGREKPVPGEEANVEG